MLIRGDGAAMTVYNAVGGEEFFEKLVDHFYDAVEHDRRIRGLYPDDLTDSRRHTAAFLVQYWGGPTTYSDERGHPRLRGRHMPFPIGQVERDAWMEHMRAAVVAMEADPAIEAAMLDYFEMAATAMMNQA